MRRKGTLSESQQTQPVKCVKTQLLSQSLVSFDELFVMSHTKRRNLNRDLQRKLLVENLDKRELFAVDATTFESSTSSELTNIQNSTLVSMLSSSLASTITIDRIERLPSVQGRFDFRIIGSAPTNSVVRVEQPTRGVIAAVNSNALGQWSAEVSNVVLVDRAFSFQASATVGSPGSVISSPVKEFQPNIIIVQADDLRADELAGLPYFASKVNSEGAVFQNSFVPTSLCGPSRASMLSGLNADHTGVHGNYSPLGGGVNYDQSQSIATWLKGAGYRTGLIGKDAILPLADQTLPSQANLTPPPGWDEYFSMAKAGYYNYSMLDNGTLVEFGNQPHEYQTDVLANRVNSFIRSRSANQTPFFLLATPFAPHSPFIPAPRHIGTATVTSIPRHENFNFPEPGQTAYPPGTISTFDRNFRERQEMNFSIDELIRGAMSELERQNELDNTIVLLTSDNGFLMGEHSLFGKQSFYEESIRVPLMIWDGRAKVASTHSELVLNLDIAPTLLDLANAPPRANLDGSNLVPLLNQQPTAWRNDFFIKNVRLGNDDGPTITENAVRTTQWLYAERSDGSKFLFDLIQDPRQVNNLIDQPSYSEIQATLTARLSQLQGPDNQGPEVSIKSVRASGTNVLEPQKIRIEVQVTDSNHGNSSVRSPEFFIGTTASFGLGTPLDAKDSLYASITEDGVVDISPLLFSGLNGSNQVFVRGRDAIGNWGAFNTVPINFVSDINIRATSDTGESSTDGLTLDTTPTFQGTAPAGSTVVLFRSPKRAQRFPTTNLIGSAVANSNGNWAITAPDLLIGEYVVTGQFQTAIGQPIQFLTPKDLHIFAKTDEENLLEIAGTSGNDSIHVIRNGNQVDLRLNGISAGTASLPPSVIVLGLEGDDEIKIEGDISSRLIGGDGDDKLLGGSGTDYLEGGDGNNELAGGPGNDIYLFPDGGHYENRNTLRRDSIRELPDQGFDRVDFRGSTKIIAEFAPSKTFSQVIIRSTRVPDRIIDFELTNYQSNIENLIGTEAADEIRTLDNLRVRGAGGIDSVVIAGLADSSVQISRHALSIESTQTTPVKAIITADRGQLRIDPDVTSGVAGLAFSGNNTASFEVRGLITNINSWFAAGGLDFYSDPTSFAPATVSFRIFDSITNAELEQDQIRVELTAQPAVQLGNNFIYTESQGAAAIASVAELTDTDGNVANGFILASFTNRIDLLDTLSVLHEGNGTNQLSVIDGLIRMNNVLVGRIQSGTLDGGLQIQLTAHATVAHAQAILRRIAFKNDSDNPVSSDRVVQVRLFDGLGVSSIAKNKTIKFNLVDDPLDFDLSPTQQFQAGTGSILVASDAIFTDPDSNVASQEITISFAGITQLGDTVSLRSTGFTAGEVGIIDRQIFVGNQHVADFSGSGTEDSPLAITLKSSSSEEHVQAILRAVTFNQTLKSPFGFDRPIRISILDRTSQQREERFVTVKVNTGAPNAFTPRSADDSFSRMDVTRDSKIQPLDVLRVINELNASGSGSAQGREIFDVNADEKITPRDALIIINRLNRISLETVEAQVLHFDTGIFPTAPKYAVSGIVRETTSLKMALDDHPYQDISSVLQSNEFLITEQHLTAMFGSIGPGQHRLRFFAELDSLLTDLVFEI
jgi:arylsulfatase A-like enzyme/Ca2+-binding RTX toxin-like protein